MEREHFYKEVSYHGNGGASGHDSVIIAYDVILGCKGSWEEVCLRGILHGGDNDSTGTIAGAWFGALYGFKGVPEGHYKEVEDVNLLKTLAGSLYKVATK
jgi:ADP-ribosylarginine hydrolase